MNFIAMGMKAGGSVLSLMGALAKASGYEAAAADVLQAGASTAGQQRQAGQRRFAEGQKSFEDTKYLEEVMESDFDAMVAKGGGGGGDPSVIKRKGQVKGRYSFLALRQLAKGQQDKYNLEFAADETERGAMRQANAYRTAASGAKISAWGSLMSSMAGGMTLFDKYGDKTKAPTVPPRPSVRSSPFASGDFTANGYRI